MHLMQSKTDNIEITISDKTDHVIKELFDPYKKKRQNNKEKKKGDYFVFDYVQLLS